MISRAWPIVTFSQIAKSNKLNNFHDIRTTIRDVNRFTQQIRVTNWPGSIVNKNGLKFLITQKGRELPLFSFDKPRPQAIEDITNKKGKVTHIKLENGEIRSLKREAKRAEMEKLVRESINVN